MTCEVQGYWQINVDSFNANGQATNQNVSAIVDTGTTFILGDTATVGEFYGAVNATDVGGGFYASKSPHIPMLAFLTLFFSVPCSAMPDVSITIGGRSFAISAETFNLGTYDSSGSSCLGAIVGSGSLAGMSMSVTGVFSYFLMFVVIRHLDSG